ncbi:solute carrier family 7 (L-type amino acid transporter), member 6 [Sarotherodon galilaeus]
MNTECKSGVQNDIQIANPRGSIGSEAETIATDVLTKGKHIDGEEKVSKHRTLEHTVVNWSRGRAGVSHASKPRATLTAHSSIIPAGGSVTLSCSVEGSAGWKFDWFRRDSQFSGAQKIGAGTSEHTISISEGGNYYCRGGRGDPVFSTEDSAPVTVQKQGPVLAAVKLQHSWSQIFTAASKPRATLTAQSSVIPAGGSVTLSCSVEGSAGWKFDWFRRDSQFSGAQKIGAGTSEHTISISEGGIYYCRGGRGDPVFSTEDSAPVTIQKQGPVLAAVKLQHSWSQIFTAASKPRATLTAQSSVIPAGGSVTLSCSVEGSAGWKFDWFRRDSQFSGAQKIGAGTSEHTISISEGGIYYCRGGRGDPVFSTEDSAPVTIQKQVLAAVKLQHSWSQIFTDK